MIKIETAQRAIEYCGASDIDDLANSFSGMSQEEIETGLREMFPQDQDGVEELAGDVYLAVANAEYLKEAWPRYF